MRWGWNVALGNCTEEWRLGLKLLNRSLRPASIVTYHPMLEVKAYELVSQVLANPDALEAHLNRFVPFLWSAFGFSNIVPTPKPLGIDSVNYSVWLWSQGSQ